MLTIRRAVYEDIPHIMKFMDEHWKPGNILAKDRSFFEWQFVEDGKVNMFIGINEEEAKIYGMEASPEKYFSNISSLVSATAS